jgi:hypothetical protein
MPANESDACCLYWVKDESCVDPSIDGYIGLTKNFNSRSRVHLRSGRFPPSATVVVLFQGTRAQCAHEENKYRKHPNVGWNLSNGGGRWRKAANPSVTQIQLVEFDET